MQITYTCNNCGKNFQAPNWRHRKFCCLKCSSDFRKGKRRKTPWLQDHKVTRETRKKISDSLKGHEYFGTKKDLTRLIRMNKEKKGKPLLYEHRQKISKARKAWCDKHFEEARKGAFRALKGNKMKNTSIELLLQNKLKDLGLSFETHQPLLNMTIPDIIFPERKIVIYADGDYWHSLPRVKERDQKQNRILKKNGWKVLRFRGNTLRENPNIVRKKLRKVGIEV